MQIFSQVREELSLYEGWLREGFPALPAEPPGRGGAQDPQGPRSPGTVTEPTVLWGESATGTGAAFPLDSILRVLSIQVKLTVIQKIPHQ